MQYTMEPNLQFDDSFFIGEELDGFYVESMMKRAWASQLEILYEIDRICKKYHIKYFADSGTLLGAVRHKGFIPWDDDIDIALMRKDYQKLFSVLKKELPSTFRVWHPQFEKYAKDPIGVVWNSEVFTTNEQFLKKFHGCPYVTGIDVFPLDYIPRDEESAVLQKELIKTLMVLAKADPSEALYEEHICSMEELLGVSFDRNGDMRRQILCLLDQIMSMYQDEESDEVTKFTFYVYDGPKYRKEWFDKAVKIPFENIMISAPLEYDNILTAMYGDYQQPVRGQSLHNYPFYKEQKKIIEEYKNHLIKQGMWDEKILCDKGIIING